MFAVLSNYVTHALPAIQPTRGAPANLGVPADVVFGDDGSASARGSVSTRSVLAMCRTASPRRRGLRRGDRRGDLARMTA